MHEVAFVTKQSHLGLLDLLRPMAAKHELTPARFDLLFAVHRYRGVRRTPCEKMLASMLSVSRATVCKMLRSLVELGFVVLSVCGEDRRRRLVHLTPLGRRRFHAVLRLARHRHVDALLKTAYLGAIAPKGGFGTWLNNFVEPMQRYIRGLQLRGVRRFPFFYGRGAGYVPGPVFRGALVKPAAKPAEPAAAAA